MCTQLGNYIITATESQVATRGNILFSSPDRPVRAAGLVAREVAREEFLCAARVGVAARQRDPLLQQTLGEHQATASGLYRG